MRIKPLIVLVLFLILVGCQHGKDLPPTYITARGEIKEGTSMPGVMRVLGNPLRITSGEGEETWHYYFGADKRYSVHFIANEVTEIEGAEVKEK